MIINCRLGDSQAFLFRDLGVYVRAEEMVSGEGRPCLGLLEIWMHFLNYAQRIYPEGVPDYKTLEWRPMKKTNETAKPRTSTTLVLEIRGETWFVLLWDSFLVYCFTFDSVSSVASLLSFYFVWGKRKGWFWHPSKF